MSLYSDKLKKQKINMMLLNYVDTRKDAPMNKSNQLGIDANGAVAIGIITAS